jgi:hypothetical protein
VRGARHVPRGGAVVSDGERGAGRDAAGGGGAGDSGGERGGGGGDGGDGGDDGSMSPGPSARAPPVDWTMRRLRSGRAMQPSVADAREGTGGSTSRQKRPPALRSERGATRNVRHKNAAAPMTLDALPRDALQALVREGGLSARDLGRLMLCDKGLRDGLRGVAPTEILLSQPAIVVSGGGSFHFNWDSLLPALEVTISKPPATRLARESAAERGSCDACVSTWVTASASTVRRLKRCFASAARLRRSSCTCHPSAGVTRVSGSTLLR